MTDKVYRNLIIFSTLMGVGVVFTLGSLIYEWRFQIRNSFCFTVPMDYIITAACAVLLICEMIFIIRAFSGSARNISWIKPICALLALNFALLVFSYIGVKNETFVDEGYFSAAGVVFVLSVFGVLLKGINMMIILFACHRSGKNISA